MAFNAEDIRNTLMEDCALKRQSRVGWKLAGGCMGWGEEAEVIEPKELREWVAETAEKMVKVYQQD